MGKKSQYIHFGRALYCLSILTMTAAFFFFFVLSFPLSADSGKAESASAAMNEKYKELFKLYHDVEVMKSKKAKLESELIQLENRIGASSEALGIYIEKIERELQDYTEMLRMRQKNGETSRIKVLLGSRDISDFLFRISLTAVVHNRYEQLVKSLDASMQVEMQLKKSLEDDRRMISEKKAEIETGITEKEKNIKKLEAYLESKGSDREEYERQLHILGEKWSALKPLFARTVRYFVELIESGGLPNDVIEVKISIGGIRGIVKEEVFNRLLAESFQKQEGATEMFFRAKDGGVYIEIPSYEVELFGFFDVSRNTLIYKVERGVFSGIEIGQSGIEDLLMGGTFQIDVTHILNIMGMELLDCKVRDGYIDVGIKIRY